jgi:hypothetical protein
MKRGTITMSQNPKGRVWNGKTRNRHRRRNSSGAYKLLRDQPKTFFVEGIRKLVDRWPKCIKKEGDYVEK